MAVLEPRVFERITERRIVRVLIAGFALVIVLLLAAGFLAVRNAQFLEDSARGLAQQQLVTTRLVDEIQREQGALSAVLYYLESETDGSSDTEILERLRAAEEHINHTLASASTDAEEDPLWAKFQAASQAFLTDARRLLGQPSPSPRAMSDLFRKHEDVVAIIARLSQDSNDQAVVREAAIQRRSLSLIDKSLLFLAAGLLLALVCVVFTVRTTATLFTNMEWQANELSRVSWHMVKDQETTARRFSHELHDELGQALTAIKANLVALSSTDQWKSGAGPRVNDCVKLADEAIRNVRQLSQLLHPVILNDFGLDAGLRWLAEGFQLRTGIGVEYVSTFTGRLPEETETHLFRIAQEALTNVARHSGATRVSMALCNDSDRTRLTIEDNGRGLAPSNGVSGDLFGVGVVGMRARARSVGGEVVLRSAVPNGVMIEVTIPAVAAS